MTESHRGRIFDLLIGGFIGGVVAAIAAVNFVIYSGMEGGYQATLPTVFDQSALVGVLTVAILVAGPFLGVIAARRLRRPRHRNETSDLTSTQQGREHDDVA